MLFRSPHFDEVNRQQLNLTQASLQQLESHWKTLEAFYGQAGQTLQWNGTGLNAELGEQTDSLEALVLSTVTRALAALRS